jgi:CheY-like chemotaxis protein
MNPILLVLDDQVQYGRSLERALRREFEVVLTTSVAEAKDRVEKGVDLVLSDIRLDESKPDDRQGLDFIRWTRSRCGTLPIIAMSAVEDPTLEQEALSCGATRFLRKPIVVSQLRLLLAELVGQRPR